MHLIRGKKRTPVSSECEKRALPEGDEKTHLAHCKRGAWSHSWPVHLQHSILPVTEKGGNFPGKRRSPGKAIAPSSGGGKLISKEDASHHYVAGSLNHLGPSKDLCRTELTEVLSTLTQTGLRGEGNQCREKRKGGILGRGKGPGDH